MAIFGALRFHCEPAVYDFTHMAMLGAFHLRSQPAACETLATRSHLLYVKLLRLNSNAALV